MPGNVLVVWQNRRTSSGQSDGIYDKRLNFTNNTVNVLDTNGISICTNTASQKYPAIFALTNGFWLSGGTIVMAASPARSSKGDFLKGRLDVVVTFPPRNRDGLVAGKQTAPFRRQEYHSENPEQH